MWHRAAKINAYVINYNAGIAVYAMPRKIEWSGIPPSSD